MKPEIQTDTSVQFLKSVGPARARDLARLGIKTVGDLLAHYPGRYFDRSSAVPIGKVRPGQEVTIAGEVMTSGERATRRGSNLLTVSVTDDTGVLFLVWFNQRFLKKQFLPGRRVMASGVVQFHGGRPQLAHPDFEISDPGNEAASAGLHTGRMVPVYGLTAGVGQHWLRRLIDQALDAVADGALETLPESLLKKYGLPSRGRALRDIHFPPDRASMTSAVDRLVYEEIFGIQMLMSLRRRSTADRRGCRLDAPGDLTRRLVEALPFKLTGAQRRSLAEILADLRSGRPMHRLLQGDVGSGKTLVALVACLFVIEQGYQAVLMAPTEVLAQQHGRSLARLCDPLQVTVETLTGSTPAKVRREILAAAGAREIDLLVGTHALIQEDVRLPGLALAVVDEQHRFGVRQRGKPAQDAEGDFSPHVLVMSATPIPRSLALTLYGDLDLSLIDELPGGRRPIITRIVQEQKEDEVWSACRRELEKGRQIYVVHPVIEETEGQDLKAATSGFERLATEVFPEFEVALLHGRMRAKEKNAVMDAFHTGRIQVLVATTVVEVGLDVPNATGLVILNPERFGLAQLHQLRGRVGRGTEQSWCWLLVDRFLPEDTYHRIRFFAEHLDGFALAEEDLRQRGPGDPWGVRQHGAPGFRLANPLRHADVVVRARQDVQEIIAADPDLKSPDGKVIRRGLATVYDRWLPLQAG